MEDTTGDKLFNKLLSTKIDIVDEFIHEYLCSCGGIAMGSPSSPEEIKGPLNCGREYACCCRAFVCKKCNRRYIGRAPAPELGWDDE